MTLHLVAFAILILAFVWGSVTAVNAGLIAIVAAFIYGTLVAGLSTKTVVGQFPADLFFILAGATLLFSIVRTTGTIDLLALWAERAARGRRMLVPVLMFLLTAVLSTAGAFTPAAVAIVAPVALDLASRYRFSRLAMGLAIVQGANAGAFSPVNPFGIVSNKILVEAGTAGGELRLYINCFLFNAVLALLGFMVVQWWLGGRARRAAAEAARKGMPAVHHHAHEAPDDTGATNVADAAPMATADTSGKAGEAKVTLTPMRAYVLAGLLALLILTLGFGVDVGVSALVISLALIIVRPSVQKPAFDLMPWSAIILVTGIVTYVGMLDEIGSIKVLEESIGKLGGGTLATLITSYLVGLVSAFASTTGTLSAITPLVVPLAASPTLSSIGVVSAISVSSSVVDISPMSTTGALLMTNAEPSQERTFFQALLLWAILMIGIVPAIAWLVFVAI